MRSDPGPLVLIGLVVALTTAVTSAATPVMARTSDRALADVVRKAGTQGAVVATFAPAEEEFGTRTRDPQAGEELQAAAKGAQYLLPHRVAAVLEPGITSVTSVPLQLLDAGPGRYLTLVHVDGLTGAAHVRYVAGAPPRATVGAARATTVLAADAPPWPVQVALSRGAASALGVRPGDRLTARDEQGHTVVVRVSGIFVARDPGDPAWQTAPQLLHPARGVTAGARTASAAALVSAAALPDLDLAVPASDLTDRVTATPRPEALHFADSGELVRALVSLKVSPELAGGAVSWDTDLDRILEGGRAQIAAAHGQADVLLVALLMCALLVLWQAADLLVRRRASAVMQTRERGGTLLEIGSELFVETAVWAVAGAVLGLACTRLIVGTVGWDWWVPIPFLAAWAAAVTGAILASRSTDPRRTPANRSARRAAARGHRLRRVLFVAAVLAAAALSFVALGQRGVVGAGGRTAATAPSWWTVAGALFVIGGLPVVARLLLDTTRRTTGGVAFSIAARLRESGMRALPVLVVTVTVAQLTFAFALTSTEHRGLAAGALLSVGGDAEGTVDAGGSAPDLAHTAAAAPGVRAAVAARVEDEVRVTSRDSVVSARLVVVTASAYEHLLAVSALPDAPQLDRLDQGGARGVVPALALGGAAGSGGGVTISAADGRPIPLTVVGTAPRVTGTVGPEIVVDADRYAQAGGAAAPNTVWAVGPGAASAVRLAVGRSGTVVTYADALAARRDAPLAAGLVRLAVVSSALLLLFAVLGVVMGAASEADPRAQSLGRLRALGLRDRQLWALLGGELGAPVLVGAVAGLLLGLSAALAMFGRLSLQLVTDQEGPPDVSLPPWVLVGAAALALTVLVLTHLEWARLRRVALGQLLRGGPPR